MKKLNWKKKENSTNICFCVELQILTKEGKSVSWCYCCHSRSIWMYLMYLQVSFSDSRTHAQRAFIFPACIEPKSQSHHQGHFLVIHNEQYEFNIYLSTSGWLCESKLKGLFCFISVIDIFFHMFSPFLLRW